MKNINLLYLSLKTVLLLTLFLGFKLGFSQSVLNDCTGMAASQDALANPAWRFITGTWRIQNGQGVIFSTNHGFVNNRFKINGPGSTNVTQITSEQIPLVRPGAQGSYRIGTPSGGGQYERMLTTFEVGPENTLLLIHFAVVLQTPNHPESQQPKFELQVFDQNNNLTPCGEYKFVAGHFPGFKKEGNKEFLNWTAASVDLTAFLGQKVTIQLSTFDCAAIAHWGFALFDIECLRSQITASDFCPGVDHQITLTAPPGFTDYAWSNGETSPTINVQNPTPGQVYSVRFKPFSILTGNCDFTLEYKIPDIAQLDIQPVHGLCVGASSTVTVSGPSDISEYTWSNGAIGPTITVSQPGVYSVSATKGDCTFTASTMVEEKPLPRFQVETQNARCFGGTGSTNCISDSTNYTYLWSTGTGTPALTDLLPGTYTVTVTTQDGCTKTEAVTVAQPPEKVVTGIEDTQKCPGKATTLSPTGDFIAYEWSNGVYTAENTVVDAGTYTVTATDSVGCTVVRSVQVTDHSEPQPQIAGSNHVCPGQTTSLQPTASFSKYEWSTGATNSSIVVGAGSFTVTVTDGNGCTNTAEQAVEQKLAPLLSLSAGDALICGATDSQIITANAPTGVSFSLNGGPGTVSNEFQVGSGGLYFIVVADTFGCTNTKEIEIRQSFDPQPSISGNRDFCENFETTLSAPAGFVAYLWSNGATTQHTIVDTTTLLTLTATDTLGCLWQTPPTQITEHQNPLAKITGEPQACQGGTKLLTAEPSSLQYLWSTGATTASQNLPPGVYSVTVTDGLGCIGVAAFTLGETPLRTVILLAVTPLVCDSTIARIEACVSNTDTTGTVNFSETFGQTIQTAFAQGVAVWEFVPTATSTVRINGIQLLGYDCPFLGLPAEVSVEVDKVQAQALPVLKANGLPISCNRVADGEINVLPMSGLAPFLYQWSPAVSISSTAEKLSAGAYTVTVTDANGCTTTAKQVLSEPTSFSSEVTGLAPRCNNINDGIISVDNTIGGQGSIRAQINNIPTSVPSEETGLSPGTYYVRLTDDLGCVFDTTIYFLEPPFYFFNVLDTLVDIELGAEWRLGVETNVPSLEAAWSPTVGIIDSSRTDAIVVSPVKDTWYTLRAVAPGNCSLPPDKVLIRVKNTEPVYVPNTFSPNNDGENDHFMPFVKTSAVKSIRRIALFDRWGELVFEKRNLLPDNDPAQSWDGTSRGKACATGVYVWYLDVEFTDGRLVQRSGDVTLIR